MCEIIICEKKYIDQAESNIIVSFQVSRGTWNTMRQTKFWKEVERFLEDQKEVNR